MTDSIMQNYNQLREQVINGDRRFQHKDGHLCFEGSIWTLWRASTPRRSMCFLSRRLFVTFMKSSRHLRRIKYQNLLCVKNLLGHGGIESHS